MTGVYRHLSAAKEKMGFHSCCVSTKVDYVLSVRYTAVQVNAVFFPDPGLYFASLYLHLALSEPFRTYVLTTA